MSAVRDSLDPTGVSVKGVHRLRRESGVTLLTVAIGMFALLSVAILTLDVVNLYMASNQAQRTADAAALAGAAALASSGTTSNGVALSTVCNGSTGDADTRAQAVAAQNLIAGLPAQSVVTACSSTLPAYNPQIQVTVTRTGIPPFLAGMFGVRTRSVSATALAEAYNPQTGYPPIAIHGVKPWAFYAPTTTTVGAALPLTPTSGSSLPMANGFYALDGPAPIAHLATRFLARQSVPAASATTWTTSAVKTALPSATGEPSAPARPSRSTRVLPRRSHRRRLQGLNA